MAAKYIVSHAGQEVGPYSDDEIKQMLLGNQLLPIDYLYDEKKQDWILLSERFDVKSLSQEMGLPPQVPGQKAKSALPKTSAYPSLSNEVPTPQPTQPRKVQPTSSETPTATFQVQPLQNNVVTETTPLNAPPPLATPPKTTTPSPASTPALATSAVAPTASTALALANATAPLGPVTPTIAAAETGVFSLPAETSSAIPAAATAAVTTQQTLKFQGGVGQVSLKQLQAGRVMIKLQDNGTNISLPVETVVNVEPGPAKTITWLSPNHCKAGEEIEVALVSRDAFDNITSAHSGDMEIVVKGQKSEKHKVNFVSGRAAVKLKWTVAETVTLELNCPDSKLALPAPLTIDIYSGPAVRLLVETPPNAVAGESMPFTVKAVDQYGNLATDFKGEINVGMIIEHSKNKAS
ncbi:MAG: hypothetical protein AB7K41_14855 [Bdellovibrionales bacterium]